MRVIFGNFAELKPIRKPKFVGRTERVLAIEVAEDHPDTPPDKIEITYKGQTLTFWPEWDI